MYTHSFESRQIWYLVLLSLIKVLWYNFTQLIELKQKFEKKFRKCQTKQILKQTTYKCIYKVSISMLCTQQKKIGIQCIEKIVQNARSPDPSFTQFVWMELIIKRKCFTYRSTFHLVIRIAPLIQAPSTFVFDLVENANQVVQLYLYF